MIAQILTFNTALQRHVSIVDNQVFNTCLCQHLTSVVSSNKEEEPVLNLLNSWYILNLIFALVGVKKWFLSF
jgi:hypothetical protein